MSEQKGLAAFGKKWSGCARILGAGTALVAACITCAGLLGVGNFLYNEVWQSKLLVYTVLPYYDLGGQTFTGLVVENRGRAPLTNVTGGGLR
jgi:hypothetical protein